MSLLQSVLVDRERLEHTSNLAQFSLQAAAEPGVMARVLELFAKRGLVPQHWLSTVSGPDDRVLTIEIRVGGLSQETVEYVANCMRQITGVEVVLTAAT